MWGNKIRIGSVGNRNGKDHLNLALLSLELKTDTFGSKVFRPFTDLSTIWSGRSLLSYYSSLQFSAIILTSRLHSVFLLFWESFGSIAGLVGEKNKNQKVGNDDFRM